MGIKRIVRKILGKEPHGVHKIRIGKRELPLQKYHPKGGGNEPGKGKKTFWQQTVVVGRKGIEKLRDRIKRAKNPGQPEK